MTEHDARPARQPRHRARHVGDPFVGEQPERGQRGVTTVHPRVYSARVTDAPSRLSAIRAAIAASARRAGRDPQSVELVAVSKTHDAAAIAPLIAAGQRVFGENRVQEAQGKWPSLKDETPGIELHLVGQLQSNKAADAVALFDAIHSLDRVSLVAALARAMDRADRRPACFVQVDLADEPQKGGCPVTMLPALLAEARAAQLPVTGLMCVPPAGLEPAPWFAFLAKLAADNGLAQLSMGMSGDFESAVALGATHVRVGTALFGSRG